MTNQWGMKTWNNIDKSSWGDGVWQSEPDKAQWITEAGLDGLIVRGPSGALCGYVGVPEKHPFFGRDYDSVGVEVHGGLTFADKCQPTDSPEKGICHIEEDAANKYVWWFGFDCAHSGDVCPKYERRFDDGYDSYKNMDYVKREVESLATQLGINKLSLDACSATGLSLGGLWTIEEMKRLASEAVAGPWIYDGEFVWAESIWGYVADPQTEDMQSGEVIPRREAHARINANGIFIAAANPKTILELIDQLSTQSARIAELENTIDAVSLIIDPTRVEKSHGRDIILWMRRYAENHAAAVAEIKALRAFIFK